MNSSCRITSRDFINLYVGQTPRMLAGNSKIGVQLKTNAIRNRRQIIEMERNFAIQIAFNVSNYFTIFLRKHIFFSWYSIISIGAIYKNIYYWISRAGLYLNDENKKNIVCLKEKSKIFCSLHRRKTSRFNGLVQMNDLNLWHHMLHIFFPQ